MAGSNKSVMPRFANLLSTAAFHSGMLMLSRASTAGGGAFTGITREEPTWMRDTQDRELAGGNMSGGRCLNAGGSEAAYATDTSWTPRKCCCSGGGGMACGNNLGAGGSEPTADPQVLGEANGVGTT